MLEKTLESPLNIKEIKPVHPKGNQSWIFIGRTDATAPILWPPDAKSWLIGKDSDAGKDWRQKEKEAAELNRITNSVDMNLSKLQEMVKDGEAWLVAVSGVKNKSDMTEWVNQNSLLYGPTLTTVHDSWKNHCFDYMDFVSKVMPLLFSALSRFVTAFLLKSKYLLISWLQSPP